MATTLLETGVITIDETFLVDSQTLFNSLVNSITWEERMRSRKAASFGVPYKAWFKPG